jgi:hypothetical protein
MFTSDVFILFAVVPATSQVTVCDEFRNQAVGVLCEVTLNGPTLAKVKFIVLRPVCPPNGLLLSRTVSEKIIVLATFGTTSQVGVKLFANTLENVGKNLCGAFEGFRDLKFGPVVLVGTGGCADNWLLNCSQQYVKASLSTSDAVPVKTNAVPKGIV